LPSAPDKPEKLKLRKPCYHNQWLVISGQWSVFIQNPRESGKFFLTGATYAVERMRPADFVIFCSRPNRIQYIFLPYA
jgi:hypothetical protein